MPRMPFGLMAEPSLPTIPIGLFMTYFTSSSDIPNITAGTTVFSASRRS